MTNGPRIAVVGAGIGGSIAALFLQRLGHDVRVYEQASRLERLGAGIGLTPNATRVCKDLGLLERMTAAGSVPRERYSRDGLSGRLTLEVPITEYPQKYGGPHVVLRRGDLHDVMIGALDETRLHLGKRVIDVATTPGSAVRLAFADGTSAEADVVIGADGINSVLRERTLPSSPSFYSGEVAHRATYPRTLLGELPIAEMTKWFSGADRYVMVFFLEPTHREIYFVTGFPQAQWSAPTFAPVATDRGALLAGFADFCEDVRRILGVAPEVTTWPICERDPAPAWSAGPIALLGDAVHAMRPHMGQGAAMAIEDAAILVRCLHASNAASPAEAFALYEALRYERTARIVLGSRGNTWMRDGMNVDWLYGYDAMREPLRADLAAAPAGR